MKTLDNLKFKGTFRNYQQRVLDNSKNYLQNNKIHIVAAPGSGKTILGLELICRLKSPCIVLSPTNTIRYQWGDRFEEMYLPNGENVNDYVSFDLNDIKPITSITYQAMHSAIDKVACIDEDNNEVDYSNIDMFKLINDYGIKTICVDEAHHLQNEWQKALEIFMKGLNKSIKVIALTATPPYDATDTEWNRYVSVCGEIDEEIFVAELVKAKNLCPHQDYVYLNYPTREESELLNKHKQNVAGAFEVLKELEFWKDLSPKILKTYRADDTEIFANIQSFIDVYGLLTKLEIPFNLKEAKYYMEVKEFPKNITSYENALNFLLKQNLLTEENKLELTKVLRAFGLIERNKVCLQNNSKIEKQLLLSMGKMESIVKIVNSENESLKQNLRMLVLTDYIRKVTLSKIGTEESFSDISIVSIFETIRRKTNVKNLAILSGTLVVLPNSLEVDVKIALGKNAKKVTVKPIANTEFSEYDFKTSNKEKVAIVGKLFEDGKINIIVGTKSLLGEGWDSPCINSLIMASFVGSFMLSNQMRGRAIRVFKKDPNKTANIWHLVTLEPENDLNQKIDCTEETSSDYKTLKRRFKCFVGPRYNNNKLESGLDRISILKQSYSKEDVESVNKQMETLSKNRNSLKDKWGVGNGNGVMYMQSTIPFDRKNIGLCILNLIQTSLIGLFAFLLLFVWADSFKGNIMEHLLTCMGVFVAIWFVIALYKTLHFLSFKRYVLTIGKAINTELYHNRFIKSFAKVKATHSKAGVNVYIELNNIKEQKVFLSAIEEFFNPIENPRYILCRTFCSFAMHKHCNAVPELFASNKKIALNFKKRLWILSPTKLIYTKSADQKRTLYLCKKGCYIKPTSKEIKQKQVN